MAINVAEVKQRLQALMNDENLVMEYIRQFGPAIDIKKIKALKEAKARASRIGESGEGEDPLFCISVICPVCNQEGIQCYELRAKSQQITLNNFLVPHYVGMAGFKTVDYSLIASTVCPRCLFSSPDKKDFIRKDASQYEEAKTQLSSNILMLLQEKIGERKAMLRSVTNYAEFFKRPRTVEAAIASYRLAIHRAAAEAWFEQPYSFYKMGAYALKIAKILKDTGEDNREALREALQYFEESFKTSNSPSEEIEMQVIYTIVALFIRFGEFKKANSYLTVFSNLKSQRLFEIKENPTLTTAIIEKWEERAKRLWEDREQPDLFKDE